MSDQYQVTYNEYNNWVLPLNLAVGFHIVLAFSIVVLPDLFKPSPKFEDIYTVNLVNLAEPAFEQVAPPTPVPQPAPEPPPKASEQAVAITDPVKPPPPKITEVKPVSLKPAKRKIKKKVKDPQKAKREELERIKRQRLAEAARADKLAAEQARIAADEAERQRRLLEAQLNQIRSQVRTTPSPRPSGGQRTGNALNVLESQYALAVQGKLLQVWALPEFKQFDSTLKAKYVIRISRDGKVTKQFFEQRSNDATFDQFVKKAVIEASPFPPFPPAIKDRSLEFELRFSPSDIKSY